MIHRHLLPLNLLCGLAVAVSPNAYAQVTTIIEGNRATSQIVVEDASQVQFEATLVLEFDDVDNLTVECLGITADALDASEIAAVRARFPNPATQQIDPLFPVRVTVEPPVPCGLTFRNDVLVDLVTDELTFVPGSPYRLFKAPVGGDFVDLTADVLPGSVRTRGRTGAFSEFVIALDGNPDPFASADGLLDELESHIEAPGVTLTAQQALEIDFGQAFAAFRAGDYTAASARLAAMETRVRSLAGNGIPNEWAAGQVFAGEAGEMISFIRSAIFHLGQIPAPP